MMQIEHRQLKKIVSLIAFIAFFSFNADADTLYVKFDELNFKCKDEEYIFKENAINKNNLLKYVLFAECKSDLYNKADLRLNEIILKLKSKELTRKYTKEKLIKDIYNEIHTNLLKAYDVNIPFYRIFEDGTYNCLTACILYVITFEQLGIEYDIKETPTHVYLVAEPKTLNITIETTTPTFGYLIHDENTKQKYVNYLVENKIITKVEFENKSINELFNKYFFSDNSIDIKQLLADLYYNVAISEINKQNIENAYINFEKSYFLSPQKKVEYYLNDLSTYILSKNELSNKRDYAMIYKLAKNTMTVSNNALLREIYDQISKDLTEKNPDLTKYETVSNAILNEIKDTALYKDIYYSFKLNKGLYAYYSGDFYNALNNIVDASIIYPENLKLKALVENVLQIELYKLKESSDIELIKNFNTDSVISIVSRNKNIANNNDLQFILLSIVIGQTSELLLDKGENEMTETLLTKVENSSFFNKNIKTKKLMTQFYLNLYRHYLRKYDYTNCRKAINRGLTYNPDDQELKDRIKDLKMNGH